LTCEPTLIHLPVSCIAYYMQICVSLSSLDLNDAVGRYVIAQTAITTLAGIVTVLTCAVLHLSLTSLKAFAKVHEQFLTQLNCRTTWCKADVCSSVIVLCDYTATVLDWSICL